MPRPLPGFDVTSELNDFGLRYAHAPNPGRIEETENIPGLLDWNIQEISKVGLGNTELPVHAYKDQILSAVADNPITIIVAETGAGKSTQVPQFLLEEGYNNIYLTQPRRAAARNVFMRIRDEISEVRGTFAGEDLVNYQTAGERDGPDDAPIKVLTDGLHLVRELHDKGIAENDVLIIDEAHEWNSNVEVLVAWTKRALAQNPSLRVVVMSATMDADHLAEYYREVCDSDPPILEIPGRGFAVTKAEKPESTVIEEVLSIVESMPGDDGSLPEGPHGILVFEPGKREINDTIEELKLRLPDGIAKKVKLFPLHSKLSPTEQQQALTEYPGNIKIVVATEVAQTSLTIPDITHVVDSGYQRRMEVDSEGTRGLRLNPISQADCQQRAGRTGRVADGHYVLTRLNATTPHVNYEDREEFPMPEILRTDVARNTLQLKAFGIEIAEFDMYHKASRHIIELAGVNLKLLDALDESGEITAVGEQMNQFPLCTSSARIMVESMRYRESTRAYLAAIVASKEVGGLQYFAYNVDKRWQDLTQEAGSDMLVQLDLFIATQDMALQDLVDHNLDINNVQRAHEQYVKIAARAGALGDRLEPPSEEEREQIKRCLYAGFLTSIYEHVGDGLYQHAFNDALSTPREISNRSLVPGKEHSFIMGDPYRVEMFDGTETVTRHFIENVSVANVMELGSLATSKVSWQFQEYVPRGGKFFQLERQHVLGINLGVLREVPADPTLRLRQEIIEHAIRKPGAELKELRKIKRQLEVLAHRAKAPVQQLTHDRIIQLVHEAAPDDITTPATIEDNLRLMRLDPERGLSLDDFVSPERRQEIIDNSPDLIEVEGHSFTVEYKSRVPVVRVTNIDSVTAIETEIVLLPDGREVKFVHVDENGHAKKYSLGQLKFRIGN